MQIPVHIVHIVHFPSQPGEQDVKLPSSGRNPPENLWKIVQHKTDISSSFWLDVLFLRAEVHDQAPW